MKIVETIKINENKLKQKGTVEIERMNQNFKMQIKHYQKQVRNLKLNKLPLNQQLLKNNLTISQPFINANQSNLIQQIIICQTQMLPNQFCYQIPMQFFSSQILPETISGTQNYNGFSGYSFSPLSHSSFYPTTLQTQGTFFNYIPCQMQIGNVTTQSDDEQKIAVLLHSKKETERSSQNFKNQISEKKHETQNFTIEGCICSKTGCIKEYCRCFKNGKACTQKCRCHHCRNLIDSQMQVKKIKKHSKGIKCNCKKSKCSNKYCDCLVAGVPCGKQCNCCDCSNH